MTKTLDYALYYAGRGWPVFPLQPKDKKPLANSKGFQDAITDRDKIAAWWNRTDYNIGIPTGSISGLLVVDVDFGHGGEDSLAVLETKNEKLPKTITARTGGGGRHLLYKMPPLDIRNSASKLGPGLDIRANGGYIAVAPSLHPTGARYAWIDQPSKTELAQAPQWLIDILKDPQRLEYEQSQPAQNKPLEGAIVTGSRNAVMASFAGTMRRRGMSEQAIISALVSENKAKCIPPLSMAELENIAKSVCRYEPTAAPILQNRERISVEWSFCKAIFDTPLLIDEFSTISPDLFQDENLRKFWKMVQDGKPATRAAADAGILQEIEKVEGSANHIDIYASQLQKIDYAENIYKAAGNLQRLAKVGDIEKIHQAIESLAENKISTPIIAKTASESLQELEDSLRNGRQFIKTKIGNIDKLTGGLERKIISILAARPSMGKTTLAWQIARNVAASGGRVLFLSLEVSAVSLWRKAAMGLAEISQSDVENNDVGISKMEEIYTDIIPNLRETYSDRLFVYDIPPYSTNTLWKVAVQTAPDLIILDHLGYVDQDAENEVHRLGEITKWGKRLAKKTNSHLMFLHQLNRGVEQRENKEPMLSDLRDSGKVEENADIVFMPYRADYYENIPIPLRYSETSLFIRKNRDGALGVGRLYFDKLHQWFYRQDEVSQNWKNEKMP